MGKLYAIEYNSGLKSLHGLYGYTGILINLDSKNI
jgi:hypothetical protein